MTNDAATLEFLGQLSRAHQQASAPAPGSGRVMRMQRRDRIQAAYDAAQTTELNKRYWQNADLLAPDSANSPEVRRTLRSRARYEVYEGNSFARGIVGTLANDLIGRGPRLQVILPGKADRTITGQIERQFHSWCRQIGLARKLRTLKQARVVDGEGFAHFFTNRRLPQVQLDLDTVEADQISSPMLYYESDKAVDGIRYDDDGNPVTYHKLKSHPGSTGIVSNIFDHDELPADDVLHTFRQDRPGQRRGIPEITTALPLFALLRDYTLAVLHNARSAAKFTGVLETQQGAFDDNQETGDQDIQDAFDAVDIDYDMMTALPYGYKFSQMKAEQPTTTYEMFRNAILNEIARCLHMPFNIAAGNSSSYNYASGRLDHQTYFLAIEVERSEWEIAVLDRILTKWLEEAMYVPGILPEGLPPFQMLGWQWFWDAREHVDPSKEATGQATRLSSGTSHRAREYAAVGLDVDEEDQKAADSYGISLETYRAALFQKHYGTPAAPQGEPKNADSTEDDPDNEDDSAETDDETADEEQPAAS